MKVILSLLSTIFCILLQTQTAIKIEEAKDHVGDSVTVKAKTPGASYPENTKNTPS